MKSSGVPISAFNAKYQGQISAQLHPKRTHGPNGEPLDANGFVKVETPRLRQSSKGPNKTEAAFAAHIRSLYPSSTIYEQEVTLVLANGLRYTPDIFFPGRGVKPAFYEVKGFMRDDAAAKIKVAAWVHSWADFWLVTKRTRKQGGGWQIEIVLP